MLFFTMLRFYLIIHCIASIGFSQSFVVEPYLQHAEPASIHILWETNENEDTRVEWGTTPMLGYNTSGTAFTNTGASQIHTVQLTGLSPDTRYYYRTVTSTLYSAVYDFFTPPLPQDNQSFKIVAMSDMQKDWSNWDKFEEIVHQGIIGYISHSYSEDIPKELQMVLIPGDLVDYGWDAYQWPDHFFSPAAPLFAHVPLYPVMGNHEYDSEYFLNYFHLPENGTEGYEEHWWYKDYSNLRVIGMDTNPNYQLDIQLSWLEDVLVDACYHPHIDFVFAQLHHPYKSELWIAGELDYTGEVISRMEIFTEECGKPSIHFFGHTHGYSRGQSQDHEHLWVNVASAGGNLDYWGEYEQRDYAEFTVSQDEWGFVIVEVQAGAQPDFRLKRISRGNGDYFLDNALRDEIRVKLHNIPPVKPTGISPEGNGINTDGIVLEADTFTDNDGDEAMAAHWQVFADCDLSNPPLVDAFVNSENWYYGMNTQESIELNRLPLEILDGSSQYCWQMRYRDSSLGWSDWSHPLTFQTEESQYTANLLLNPGGENGTEHWQVLEGYMESLEAYACDGIAPFNGSFYFAVGALCNSADYSEASQRVEVAEYSHCINSGAAAAYFGGYLSNWGGSDHPEMQLIFLNEEDEIIGESSILDTYNDAWTSLSESIALPLETYSIEMVLMGTRNAGVDNDSYFDDVFLKLFRDESCLDQILPGDLNQDTVHDILDIILMVNLILTGDIYDSNADMNGDGSINILDVISLVNIILDS
ncbi:MAG: fibronectin type III domain-containing protein [Candidatus Marinimicrobia bacterium]|nr:fibronectin type III domain-containing protein [Candidatus Neomarinimicrobiota bacterium]